MSNLDKFVLKFERIKGDLGGIKNKVVGKLKPQKHPFLKGHKLDTGWAEKLEKTAVSTKKHKSYSKGATKGKITLVKAKVNKPAQKVSRRRTQ